VCARGGPGEDEGEAMREPEREPAALPGVVSASRMSRTERTMLSWMTDRQRMRSSRKAVGV
jgi:hypothetical protein